MGLFLVWGDIFCNITACCVRTQFTHQWSAQAPAPLGPSPADQRANTHSEILWLLSQPPQDTVTPTSGLSGPCLQLTRVLTAEGQGSKNSKPCSQRPQDLTLPTSGSALASGLVYTYQSSRTCPETLWTQCLIALRPTSGWGHPEPLSQ